MKISYLLAAMGILTAAHTATAQRTPLMGWSSWNTYGLEINEQLIKEQADAMVSTGLKDAGYKFINIDDGLWNGRAEDGTLIVDFKKFPKGMRGVSDYIHSLGLKAGIYSDAGDNTCGSQNRDPYGLNVGLFRHEKEDCKTYFIDWNYDFIKVDYCGGIHLNLDDRKQYSKIADAIKNCGRDDIQFNICRWAYPGTWVADVADSWRTTEDIWDGWESVAGIIAQNLYLSSYCRNGHYNDMDMLEVGRSLSPIEDQTHFAMWCIMSSPLLVGCDMRTMKQETIDLLTNRELIALNQDPLHLQAYVADKTDDCYVLVKDIEQRFGNTRAIAVYNPTSSGRKVTIDLRKLELGGDVRMRDLLHGKDLGLNSSGKYQISVPAHGVAVLKATASDRLERERYEGECGYISDYQELANNELLRTGIYATDEACSGGAKAGWLGYKEENDLIFEDVYSKKGGAYDMTIAYLSADNREIVIEVNGKKVATITGNSGSYSKVGTTTVPIKLKKGVNTIRLSNPDYFMPDIDYIDITPAKSGGKVTDTTGNRNNNPYNQQGGNLSNAENFSLERDFASPPDDVKTGVYWYWIEGNITEDGVIKDLEAMKSAGINRAFIANIGGAGTGDPNALHKVEFMSEEWWKITHAALKRATELGIEIGMFNSPGWSQSGGPWIKSNQTMRYLASTRKVVKGPGKVNIAMPVPTAEFEDVKTIAFRNPMPESSVISPDNAQITVTPASEGADSMFDGDNLTGMKFSSDGVTTIDIKTDGPFTARSIVVRALPFPISTDIELQAPDADGNYRTISRFNLHRVRDWKKVGFDPYADVAISFLPVTSESFRVIVYSGNPQNGIAELTLSETPRVERFKEKSLAKLFQNEVPSWDEYLWREQPEASDRTLGLKPNEIIDISDHLSPDGTLVWDVPAGEWVVMRTGMSPTGVVNEPACPEATGYEVDKLSREHAESHFNDYIGQILKRIPEEDRRCFKLLVQDSYEVGGQNFTDNLLEIFKQRYGYDPLPYLPVLEGYVVGSQHDSDAFLWDLRRLVADRISYEYVGGTRDVAHRHGLTTWLENYGHWGFPGEFLQYGGQADEVGGEFWADPPYGEVENRLATSCSHIYGKRLTSSESSTSGGPAYLRTPDDLKSRMDRYFTYGINNTVLHLYIHQPDELRLPGSNAWFGTEFNRNNTWFKFIDLYTDYIKRCNLMMRQGWYQSDVAYFIGEDAPRMVGKMEPWIPAGYQFEHINAEVIIRDLEVKDGLLTLPHGITFKALVLPPTLKTMRPELLRKIEKLVREGGVVVGPAPERTPSLEHGAKADKEVRKLARKVWGNVDGEKVKQRRYGKGMVFHGLEFTDIFNQLGYLPDCKVPEGLNIYQGHQKDGETDIYILSNQEGRPVNMDVAFRITGKQPELWDPLTGTHRQLPAYSFTEQTTVVPMKLDKGECVFVVFRDYGPGGSGDINLNYPVPTAVQEITSVWDVSFEGAFKTPSPIRMQHLENLSDNTSDSVRYFSGTSIYTTTVPLSKAETGKRKMLCFDKVGTMGKVYVNDKYAGGVWTTPYKVDITDLVKDGDNQIRVEVANTWVNRIVGDLNLPDDERDVYLFVNPYNAGSPLPPSGLIGSARIETY